MSACTRTPSLRSMAIERLLVARYRKVHPESRIASICRYVRNGSTVRQRGCALCGRAGPTWNGRWPITVRAAQWEDEHIANHVARFRMRNSERSLVACNEIAGMA